VIQLRHRQPSLWHSGLARDIEDLWEPWMKEVDQLLEDAALVESVYDAQGKRHPNSRDAWTSANTGGSGASTADLILGVAAAEVGFEQFASKTLPDTAWLLEFPSPPLFDMLQKFPWKQLKIRINGSIPVGPDSIIDELRTGVGLRNKIVHSGVARLSPERLDSFLDAVKNLIYFLDVLHGSGQNWPLNFIDPDVIKSFKQA
jgi:hypothetical protein